MKNNISKYILIGFQILLFQSIYAQQDTLLLPSFFLKIDNLNFNKNNEYYNNIADGYTLIGTQIHPKIIYKPSLDIQLELGVFTLFYAGTEKYNKVIPTFSLDYNMGNIKMTAGTLHNESLHNLIAPLMTSETILTERRLENGSQMRYNSDKFNLDAWLNWETFIFKGESKHEEIMIGLSADYKLLDRNKWELIIPLQNLFYHHGGQINTDFLIERNTFTMRHTALGVDIGYAFSEEKKLRFNSFYIDYQSTPNHDQYKFLKGIGILNELDFQYKHFKLGLGYWMGDKFVSPRGDDMFQSASKKTDIHYIDGVLQPFYSNHTEPKRTLFFGKLNYKNEILPDLFVSTELNVYYQNYSSNPTPNDVENEVKKRFDYSSFVKIKYSGLIKIKN